MLNCFQPKAKKPFVKMAKDVEFQKMANREFRRKAKKEVKPQITEERRKELASLGNASSYRTKTRHSKA